MPAAAALLFVFAVWLTLALRKRWERFIGGRRQRVGKRAEDSARGVLRDHGYSIVESQRPARAHVTIDGKRHTSTVRVDYIVEKNGLTYAAEVKGGARRSATRDSTRRQLLEYALIYEGISGVLLVDAVDGVVHTIEFDYL